MASDLGLAPELYRCYYCKYESTGDSFMYFDNKKEDQPRFKCKQCHKLFTVGSHGRPQGRTYTKKRNEDPPHLKSLSRQCRHCGVADNAVFKYYNNYNQLQPRFKCLSCGKQFQMRLMGTGDEMRLVHTSSNQRHATRCGKKQSVPEAVMNASNFVDLESDQPSNGFSMPLESNAGLLPESWEEDEQYACFLDAELMDENEQASNVDPMCWDPNVDNGLLPPLSIEEAQTLGFPEFESFTNENEQASNVDPTFGTFNGDEGLTTAFSAAECAEYAELLAFCEAGLLTDGNDARNFDTCSSTANVDDGLPPWTYNDAELRDVSSNEFDAGEVVCENTTNMDSNCTFNPAVVSNTPFVETLGDSSSSNYLQAAVACCELLNLAPVQLGESSSSSADLTTSFEASSCATSQPISFLQDLMEEDQCSDNGWNEWQAEVEMAA